MQQILGYIRRAITEYGMIQNGDTIAVGVSGGKDSVALLVGLARVRSFIGIDFSLKAITLDNQFNGLPSDYSKIQQLCDEYGIPYLIRRTDIGSIVFDTRNETNPCSLCARMRRGLLHDTTKALGCNKIALGHHYDDAVETFLMNLFKRAMTYSIINDSLRTFRDHGVQERDHLRKTHELNCTLCVVFIFPHWWNEDNKWIRC